MSRCIRLMGLGLLLLPLLCAADELKTQNDPASSSPYVNAVRKVIERNQRNLVRDTDLWVDHTTWENAWRVRTGSFIVRTSHSWRLGRDLGTRLEMMLEEFKLDLKPDFAPTEPLVVYICPGLAQYNQFGEQVGEHHSSLYGSFFAPNHDERAVIVLYDENETLLTMFTVHSVLHQLIDRAFSRTPPDWISEGLASYYAFRWAYAWGVSQLRELVTNRRFVSFEEIMQTPLSDYGGATTVYFTELGMLFYYLMNFREDTRMTEDNEGDFITYLRAVLTGANTSGLPCHDLITNRLDQLEADFKAYPFPVE